MRPAMVVSERVPLVGFTWETQLLNLFLDCPIIVERHRLVPVEWNSNHIHDEINSR